MGTGAQNGILFKDAAAIETLRHVDTLIVDKTGTLTEGKPTVDRIIPTADMSQDAILQMAASLEQASEHPIARALVKAAQIRNLQLSAPLEFKAVSGFGATGRVDQQSIALGNLTLMHQCNISVTPVEASEVQSQIEGRSVVYVGINGSIVGFITLSDHVKTSTSEALNMLTQSGVHIVMATGDHHRAAAHIGNQLGIHSIHADVTPEGKLALVELFQNDGRIVAMAGDGINDAPALAKANIGIAMGTGTDIAINTAQITLVKGDLRGIAAAKQLSVATVRNMKQNLLFALLYNTIGIPIAAGVLYPFTGMLLSPMIAALAMSLSSLSVVGNALRLGLSQKRQMA